MPPKTATYTELIERLTPEATLTLYGISWETYEDLLEAVGEAPALRISYNEGVMHIMTTSFEHEFYAQCLNHLVGVVRMVNKIKIISFGRATMKKQEKLKGAEPDASFYVKSVATIGNRFRLDLAVDPPPDIVVETDLFHDSQSKFPIHAALGVPEIWRFDGKQLAIHRLKNDSYEEMPASLELPMLTGEILTKFLTRAEEDDQDGALRAFEDWLRSQPK
jgi:Uma2 family endonuclease